MHDLDENKFNTFLDKIRKQFLSCYPLHCIVWKDIPKNLNWEQQKVLVENTFNCSLNKQLPIKLSYQLNFMKKLLSILEEECQEVHDIVYETFCRIQQNLASDCAEKFAFKHYLLNPELHLSLRESKSFVAEGTTGLCSWQASLALADFLIENPILVRSKTVLELGAGTGLSGLSILKLCQPEYLMLTDGSSSCVELMIEGLKINFPEALEEEPMFKINKQTVECLVVPWESIQDMTEVSLLKPEIVIAADVVYDDSCFKDLSLAIDYLFKLRGNEVQMFLAATVRNITTLNGFLNIIGCLNFKVTECEVVPLEKSIFFWDRSTSVKILKLTRK